MLIENYKYPLYNIPEKKDFREMLKLTVNAYPKKESFFEKDKDKIYRGISYLDFQNSVEGLGEALLGLKQLKERDKIALIGRNSKKWAQSYLSITTANFIVVPLDKENKVNELQGIVSKARIKAIIFDNKFEEIVYQLKKNNSFIEILIPFETNKEKLSVETLTKQGMSIIKENKGQYKDIKIDPNAVSSIIFTSGTTGTPKGVMLSQKNILSNIAQMRSLFNIDNSSIFLSCLPLHHAYECTCGFLCPVEAGSTIYYAESLRKIADNLAEAGATIMLGVPLLFRTFYHRIREKAFAGKIGFLKFKIIDLICTLSEYIFIKGLRRKIFAPLHKKFGGNLKTFISGGAAIEPEIEAFFTGLGILTVQGYGITECSPLLAVNRDRSYNFSSVGYPAPGIDIAIFERDDKGIGEIAVKGANVMLGYYEDKKSTDAAFKDGYFLTGDYGYLDKKNFLHIAGRKKDVIVTENGKNIHPEEIEFYYVDTPEISEIVVLAGRDPKNNNETIFAAIFPNFELLSEILSEKEESLKKNHILFSDIIKKRIMENNKKISIYKRVKYFTLTNNEFQKTSSKKIQRFKIKVDKNIYPVY